MEISGVEISVISIFIVYNLPSNSFSVEDFDFFCFQKRCALWRFQLPSPHVRKSSL